MKRIISVFIVIGVLCSCMSFISSAKTEVTSVEPIRLERVLSCTIIDAFFEYDFTFWNHLGEDITIEFYSTYSPQYAAGNYDDISYYVINNVHHADATFVKKQNRAMPEEVTVMRYAYEDMYDLDHDRFPLRLSYLATLKVLVDKSQEVITRAYSPTVEVEFSYAPGDNDPELSVSGRTCTLASNGQRASFRFTVEAEQYYETSLGDNPFSGQWLYWEWDVTEIVTWSDLDV